MNFTKKEDVLYIKRENKMKENIDEKYMRMAIELAKKGAGAVKPNPMVGAVVVQAGRVIGTGYHK